MSIEESLGGEMKKNKIYVTTMYRYGSKEGHSYVRYAGFSKAGAVKAGKDEYERRGHKYEYEVVEFTPGDVDSIKYLERL